MANTPAGDALTEAYRRLQLRIRAATIADVVAVWPAFRLEDIDGSWGPVEAALLAIVARRRTAAAASSSNYYRAFRLAEEVDGVATPVIAPRQPPRLTIATLRLVGPIGTKKSIAAGTSNPMDVALTRMTGSTSRMVLDAGRQTLVASVKADRKAQGWRRVTSANPCDFCAELADRGPVYKSDTADFEAHDHCGCTSEVVY